MTLRLPASPVPTGFYSRSTPNLPTLGSLTSDHDHHSSPTLTSPSEAASLEDFSLDAMDSGGEDEDENAQDYDDKRGGGGGGGGGEGRGKEGGAEEQGGKEEEEERPIYKNKHSQSHTYLGPPVTFAPPFYNRPPTPLPPSPSLTSLLRPTFSTSVSRPTTPDPSSGDEAAATASTTPNTITAAATTLTTSFRTAKPIPRASPKVPTYEYYGFTLYLTSSLSFAFYLLWSYLPSPFLHQLGIYYYPNRWWSLAIPAWLVMLVCYIYVALAAYNTGYLTLNMQAIECLVDETGNVAVVDGKGRIIRKDDEGRWKEGLMHKRAFSAASTRDGGNGTYLRWRDLWSEGTDAVMDVPIGGVCEILYGEGRVDDE
jgi:phosphatidylinositol glycan class P protein